MSSVRKIRRNREHAIRKAAESSRRKDAEFTGRDLAVKAARAHETGLQLAHDHLQETLSEGDKEARRTLRVTQREAPNAVPGRVMHIVALTEKLESGTDHNHVEIAVATRQDPLQATDQASATMVVWRTKVATIIREEDGSAGFHLLEELVNHATIEHGATL